MLVRRATWARFSEQQRAALYDTHAGVGDLGFCEDCYVPEHEVAYRGDWIKDGLILRPTRPRQPEHLRAGHA